MSVNQPSPYAPCHCGSGKKYKFCCRDRDRAAARRDSRDYSWPEPDASSALEPDVTDSQDQSERFNKKGVGLMQQGKFDKAAGWFQRAIKQCPENPAGHNNLALTKFMTGNVEEAIRMQVRAVEDLPFENPFGMAQLARFYLVAGREDDARKTLDRARRQPITSPFAVTQICQTLIQMKRFRDVLDIVRDYSGEAQPATYWYAAVAAANLGDSETAASYLRECVNDKAFRPRALKMLRRIEGGKGPGTVDGAWPAFIPTEILPRSILQRVAERVDRYEEDETPLLNTSVMVAAVVALLNEDGGERPGLLDIPGAMTHPGADELLEKIATGTFGTDELRMAAVHYLNRKGVWESGKKRTLWLQGEWREIAAGGYRVNPDKPASNRDIPPEIMPRYERAVEAAENGHFKQAENQWGTLIAEYPEHPAFLYNLAVALINQKRHDEAEELLKQATAIEPDYLFPLCTLALLYVDTGRIEEARQQLDSIPPPEEVHPAVLATYITCQIQVAVHEENVDAALSWLDMGEQMFPDHPMISELSARLSPIIA